MFTCLACGRCASKYNIWAVCDRRALTDPRSALRCGPSCNQKVQLLAEVCHASREGDLALAKIRHIRAELLQVPHLALDESCESSGLACAFTDSSSDCGDCGVLLLLLRQQLLDQR